MFSIKYFRKSAAVVTAALVVAASASAGENFLSLSLGDLYAIAKGDGRVDSPERIEASLKNWKTLIEGSAVLWRIEDQHIEFFEMAKTGYIKWHRDKVVEMQKKFDHHKVAREACDKLGLKLYLNYSFNDGGWPAVVDGYRTYYCYQDKELIARPHLQEVDKRGVYHYGYLDLSNPEAREFIIGRIKYYMAKTKADGLYLNSRTHSGLYSQNRGYKPGPHHADRFGFGKAAVAEYKKRYGIDVMTDPRFDYKDPKFAPKSVEMENWRKLRGEYFITFYKEVKKAIGNKTLILTLPLGNYMGSSGGNIYVDHERIINEKAGDILQLGVASGFVPNNLQRKLGYLSSEERDANYNVPTIEEYLKRHGKAIKAKGLKVYTFIKAPYSEEMKKMMPEGQTAYTVAMLPSVCHPVFPDTQALRPLNGVFSCEAIIRPTYAGYSLGRIFSKFNHKISKPVQRGWELIVEQKPIKKSKPQLHLQFRVYARIPKKGVPIDRWSGKEFTLVSDEVIPYNEWSHIGATWDADNGKMSIYINGKCVKSLDFPKGAVFNQNTLTPCYVGTYAGAFGYDYHGMIESIRFSSKPIAECGKIPEYTGKEPGTVMFMDYSKGSTKPVIDIPGAPMKYLLTPKLKDGRDGRKALWFCDEQ